MSTLASLLAAWPVAVRFNSRSEIHYVANYYFTTDLTDTLLLTLCHQIHVR